MQRSIYQHIILDTIAASGADVVVKNRHLYIDGELMWKFDDIQRDSVSKEVAITSETAGVLTYTPPAVPLNDTAYSVQFSVANPGATGAQSDPLVFNITVTTPATGSLTNTTLNDQFRTQIAKAPYSTYVTGSGTTTLIVTAKAGYPVVIGSSTAPITVAQTTTGIQKRGTPATMAVLGVGGTNTVYLDGTDSLAGTAYTIYYSLEHRNIGESNTARVNQGWQKCLWIDEGATNYAAFITEIDKALAGNATYIADEVAVNG